MRDRGRRDSLSVSVNYIEDNSNHNSNHHNGGQQCLHDDDENIYTVNEHKRSSIKWRSAIWNDDIYSMHYYS